MSGVPGIRQIAWASRLVPELRRATWRREWEAEVAYAWQRACAEGEPGALTRTRLHIRVLSCWIDALMEKKETIRMTGLFNDLRFAVRGLLRRPGFTAIAVLTLALGMGATTAVFTLLDGVMLRPLPYTQPDQLLSLQHLGRDGQDEVPISAGLYVLYRDQAKTLASIAMYTSAVGNLVVDGEPERVAGQTVTPSFFRTLDVNAARGRTFLEEEGQPGGEPVVILSDGLWRARFGADAAIIGRTVDINGVRREVVGVMPAGFGHPDAEARFWTPLIVNPSNAPVASFVASGMARMAPGQTLEGARAEIEGMLQRLPELVPGDGGAQFLVNVGIRSRITPLKEALVGDIQQTLWVLFATVGIVLLIACANVANLLLVRAEGRQRELAVRMALGAGRAQVLRSFLGESALLALAGGALGIVVANLAVTYTATLIPTDLPRMAEIGIDARVLGFTAAVALGCALFFGFFPLLRYGAHDLVEHLREGSRGATGGPKRHRLRNALVVSQVAMALVLLVGSGLMLRSFLALRAVDAGFDPNGTLTARIIVPTAEVPDWRATDQFFHQLRQRLEALPGVTAVGMISSVPLGGSGMPYTTIGVEDHPRGPDELQIFAYWPQVSAGYFEAMGIRILEGRGFEPTDGGDGFPAAVVSRAFANQWWPGTSAIGRRLRPGVDDEPWYEIVGIAEDVRHTGLEQVTQEMIYLPTVIEAFGEVNVARGLDVVIRTNGDPLALVGALRREVRELNPRIPIANPRTMEAVFKSATARTSFTMAMLGAASGIALILGLVGIYGVISYVVSQRTREIGVRMALGASGSSVRGMVVRQGLLLAATGAALGLLVAALVSRAMGSLLYGVSAFDPTTYLAVAASLVLIAALASLLPALRAAGVQPSVALRNE